MFAHSRKNLKRILSVLIVVLLFSALVGCNNSDKNKMVDFDVKYDGESIEKFMKKVCKNVDAESVEIIKVEGSSSSCFYVTLAVKLDGKIEEKIEVGFYNQEDSDKVSKIAITYGNYNSDNQISCKDAVAEALEISLNGSSKAKQYTADIMPTAATLDYGDNVLLIWYELAGGLGVNIHCNSSGGTYSIYKK